MSCFYRSGRRGCRRVAASVFQVYDASLSQYTMAEVLTEPVRKTPVFVRFSLPDRLLHDASVFVDTGLTLETALAGAYLAATRQFAEPGQPALAATAASLGASDAQHLTLRGHLAGSYTDDLALSTPSFRRAAGARAVPGWGRRVLWAGGHRRRAVEITSRWRPKARC